MFDLIDTAITGDQFLLALHDTLIMVAVSLGFGALIGVPLGIVLVVCRPGGIADSGPHHGDHRSARRHSHGGYSGRRGNRGSGYYLWLSALRRFRHPHYRPGADCDCPAYPDAGHPTGSPTAP